MPALPAPAANTASAQMLALPAPPANTAADADIAVHNALQELAEHGNLAIVPFSDKSNAEAGGVPRAFFPLLADGFLDSVGDIMATDTIPTIEDCFQRGATTSSTNSEEDATALSSNIMEKFFQKHEAFGEDAVTYYDASSRYKKQCCHCELGHPFPSSVTYQTCCGSICKLNSEQNLIVFAKILQEQLVSLANKAGGGNKLCFSCHADLVLACRSHFRTNAEAYVRTCFAALASARGKWHRFPPKLNFMPLTELVHSDEDRMTPILASCRAFSVSCRALPVQDRTPYRYEGPTNR